MLVICSCVTMRLFIHLLCLLYFSLSTVVLALTIDGNDEQKVNPVQAAPWGKVVLTPSSDGAALIPTLVPHEAENNDKTKDIKAAANPNQDQKEHLGSNFVVAETAPNRVPDANWSDSEAMVANTVELAPGHVSYGGYYGQGSSYGMASSLNGCANGACAPQIRLHSNHTINDLLRKAYDASSAGRANEALDHYLLVKERSPSNQTALFGIAFSYQTLARYPEAVQAYVEMLKLGYRSSEIVNNLAVSVGVIDPMHAIKALKSIEQHFQDNPLILAQLGILHAKLQMYDKAQRYLMRALYADGGNPFILYNLAVVCDKMSLGKQALRYYRLVIDHLNHQDNAKGWTSNIEQLEKRIKQLSVIYTH